MIGACVVVIISSMATSTSSGSIVVIADVTSSTFIGDFNMSACEGIKLIVSREGSRAPSRNGRVTGSAISGNTESFMVRIER